MIAILVVIALLVFLFVVFDAIEFSESKKSKKEIDTSLDDYFKLRHEIMVSISNGFREMAADLRSEMDAKKIAQSTSDLMYQLRIVEEEENYEECEKIRDMLKIHE